MTVSKIPVKKSKLTRKKITKAQKEPVAKHTFEGSNITNMYLPKYIENKSEAQKRIPGRTTIYSTAYVYMSQFKW